MNSQNSERIGWQLSNDKERDAPPVIWQQLGLWRNGVSITKGEEDDCNMGVDPGIVDSRSKWLAMGI